MHHKFIAAWAIALAALTWGAVDAAPITKLSGTIVVGGDVSPSGSTISAGATPRAIFIADREINFTNELWSTPLTGGTPVKLSGTTAAVGGVLSFKVSPDGNWVAFVAGATGGVGEQLWLVVNDGSAATPAAVSGTLVGFGGVRDYQWSPNSLRIAFSAAKDAVNTVELYSKPVIGALVNLSALPTTGRNVSSWRIAPDGSRVVFSADKTLLGLIELFSVPLIGGTAARLTGAIVVSATVSAFLISANSSRVAFLQDRDVNDVPDLYSSVLDGSAAPIKLSSGLLGALGVTHFRITPDGARVVYRAVRDTVGVSELYGASATTVGASIKLSGALVTGGSVGPGLMALTPDGQRVIFLATKDRAAFFDLYSAPVNVADAAVRISDPTASLFRVFNFSICPNAVCVVYSAFPTVPGAAPSKLIATTATAATPIDLSAPIGIIATSLSSTTSTTSHSAFGIQITPDSRRVLWTDTRDPASPSTVGAQLFSSPISVAAPVAVSGQVVAGGAVQSTLAISADSTKVLFSGDKDTDNVNELYVTALDGGGSILDIDGDGVVLPTTDGLMLTRWQLGIRGAALFGGITFSVTATRTSVTAIEDHLRRLTESGVGW